MYTRKTKGTAMSDEIRLKERSGPTPVPPADTETGGTSAVEESVVDLPLRGTRQESSPPPSSGAGMSLVHYLDEPLWRSKGWIKLMGILFILNGVLMIFSLWGIILCWLPIWLGLTLMSAAKNIRAAAELNNRECMRLALEKLGLYFKINGIMVVVGLVLGILIGVAVAAGVLGSVSMMNHGMPHMMQ
jgi:hypothetical protein